MSDLALEAAARADGRRVVCGVDEAGRGPLAGPVVAAAVVLGRDVPPGLDDSKKLTAARREALFVDILTTANVSVASACATTVDRINVRAATLDAMARAVRGLEAAADFALVDGDALPPLPCPARAVVGGDGLSASIAAASIVAKVARDRMMAIADERWPLYGLGGHKGYPTPTHRAALEEHGPSPLHRRSFGTVRKLAARR